MTSQAADKSKQELARLESAQQDMVMKLASAERELAQLRSSTRKTEFELLGRQQEVNAQLEAAKKQLAEAQAKAVDATKQAANDGSAAKDQFNKVSGSTSVSRLRWQGC